MSEYVADEGALHAQSSREPGYFSGVPSPDRSLRDKIPDALRAARTRSSYEPSSGEAGIALQDYAVSSHLRPVTVD